MKAETKQEIKEWVIDIVVSVLIALAIFAVIKPIIIQQNSMEPNFYTGDYIIVSRLAYTVFGEPERGDIVVFKSDLELENGKKKNLIKRIVGLPGDEVSIVDGYVYINGEMLDEPYVKEQGISGEMEPQIVPEGCLFCCGDNRGVSLDSRDPSVGMVEEERLVGKVKLRVYPFNSIKRF